MVSTRSFHPGMGQAVAERTILRRKADGRFEEWGDVALRVSRGNSLLCGPEEDREAEFDSLHKHISKVNLLMSGRHLQHGDETQPSRNQEVFTNCASAATSFALFMLLCAGSGVGRCYDDDMMIVNWDYAPNIRCVISDKHPDYDHVAHESVREAKHKYGKHDVMWFTVPDTREGWAQAVEICENAAFEKIHKDKLLILDFSEIRCKGTPIKGMQNRPASGPVPLMNAFMKIASLKGSALEPWRQTMYVDHYLAECVLVGGARRSARMSVKSWRDKSVLDFIQIKRPIEFIGKSREEIEKLRKESRPFGFLWSSNNSILVDDEFWSLIQNNDQSELGKHAREVFELTTLCAYADGTGEPGIINQDKLVQNSEGFSTILKEGYLGSSKYQPREETEVYLNRLAKRAKNKKFYTIVNPCSEISFHLLGAFCVSGDTRILHRNGYHKIRDLVGYEIEVWNGEQWSEVTPIQTGRDRSLLRVHISDGTYLDCTPEHEFAVVTENGLLKMKAKELHEGDRLPDFSIPDDVSGESVRNSYEYGVHVGKEMRINQSSYEFPDQVYQWDRPTLTAFLNGIADSANCCGSKIVDDVVHSLQLLSRRAGRNPESQTVKRIELLDGKHDTFCFEEPIRHMGVFNNILTYQCVIADVVPFFSDSLDEAEDAFRTATRALIRVNTMDSIYRKEVRRTNRIGIGMTGVHEFAWKFFRYNFHDLINEEKSLDFWMTLSRFNRAVREEAESYSKKHGLPYPHTLTTIKPAGTTSKLFGLTEGWHLPSMSWYLRWVQFSDTDPLVKQYVDCGYPHRFLKQYKNTVIIGFPTEPMLASMMPPEKMVLAGEATPEEQYRWIMLGEKYWIEGVDQDGNANPLRGNNISMTLKYRPDLVDYDTFRKTILDYQPRVRCCSVMPQEDISSYEYTPEQPISREQYNAILAGIKKSVVEDIGKEHIDCANGACPVDFRTNKDDA